MYTFAKLVNHFLSNFNVKMVRKSALDAIHEQLHEASEKERIAMLQLVSCKKELDSAQWTLSHSVVINDYVYVPKSRPSFSKSRIGKIISEDFEKNLDIYQAKVDAIAKYREFLKGIPLTDPLSPNMPFWKNGWIPAIDGAMIYTTLADNNPRYYVECGSGNTTKFAAKAISDHKLRTKIISIDPFPRAEIDEICDTIFRIPFEEMDIGFFSGLSAEDVFILDNSHRAFTNSDVTVFFTEVLPELPQGLIYALHDIALPDETYAERYYNEQYMLATYILGGKMGDSIYFPTGYLSNHTDLLKKLSADLAIHPDIPMYNIDGFFWMRRGG